MAERKRQKILILIFLIAAFIGIIWFLWPRFKPTLPAIPEPKREKLEINFGVLENPILDQLQPFEEIKPFEQEFGRENPFLPY